MSMKTSIAHVHTLIARAVENRAPHESMQLAQAALNAANALMTLSSIPPTPDRPSAD